MRLKNRIGTVKSKRLAPSELAASLRKTAKSAVVHLGPSEFSLDSVVIGSIRRGRRNGAVVSKRIAASKNGTRKAAYKV